MTSSSAEIACVHFLSPKGIVTSGLVRADWLNFRSTSEARLDKEGLGTWSNGPNTTITLSRGGDDFILIEAFTQLDSPSYRSNTVSGVAFLSNFARNAGMEGDHYTGEEPSDASPPPVDTNACRMRLRLIDATFLVADSNDYCGLPFNGLYRKSR